MRTAFAASLVGLSLGLAAFTANAAADPAPPAPAEPTTQAAPAEQPYIEPQNALERSLIAAADNEDMRAAFRMSFLESRVALALSARDPEAPPRLINLDGGVRACLIFASAARAAAVMGADAPVVMLTGREALTRVRGANVIININLRPLLTLDSEGIDAFLDIPAPANTAPPAPPPAPPSGGPTQ